MSVDVKIMDGLGNNGYLAGVDSEHNLSVVNSQIPPKTPKGVVQIFREFFKTEAGSENMLVDGSITNLEFYIGASQVADRYISTVSFVLADAGLTLSKFANIRALTNGVEFLYEDENGKQVTIHEGIKSNFDFIQLCNGNPAFGPTFTATNVKGNSEAIIPVLSFSDVFGIPWGIRLPKGSTERIVIKIRDDLRVPDRFDVTASGFDRIK